MASSPAAALKDAAQIIAREARKISGRFSRRIPATIDVGTPRGGNSDVIEVPIYAGGPEAPHAGMFETFGARHPLFGNKEHWYPQPYRPFLEEAAEAKGDAAMREFADEVIDILLRRMEI